MAGADLYDLAQSIDWSAPDAPVPQPRPQVVLPAIDYANLPRMPAPKPNLVAAGLKAGYHELLGTGASAAQAAGKLTGLQGLEDWGAQAAANQQAQAQDVGRPDLETAPWREGGAPWAPWLAYQAAKQVPYMGAMLLGGEALAPFVPARLAAAAAPVAERVAPFLGAEAGEAVNGEKLARQFFGTTAANYPSAVGSMYQEANERAQNGGEPTTRADALKAAALGLPYGMTEAIEAAPLRMFAQAAEHAGERGLKNTASEIFKASAKNVVNEGIAEGVQTAMEQSFRGDLSFSDKARNVVDGALTGGLVGGVFGGAAKTIGSVRPAQVTNEDLKQETDQALGQAQPAPTPVAEPAPEAPVAPAAEAAPPLPPVEPSQERSGQLRMGNVRTQPLNPFAKESDESVQQALQQVEAKMQAGGATQNDAQMRRLLLSEVERRSQAGSTDVNTAQGELFNAPPPAPVETKPAAPPIKGAVTAERLQETEDKVAAAWAKAQETGRKQDRVRAANLQAQRDAMRDILDTQNKVETARASDAAAQMARAQSIFNESQQGQTQTNALEGLPFNLTTEQVTQPETAPVAQEEPPMGGRSGRRGKRARAQSSVQEQTIGGEGALQEPSATGNDVQSNAEIGGKVPGGYAEGSLAPDASGRTSAVSGSGEISPAPGPLEGQNAAGQGQNAGVEGQVGPLEGQGPAGQGQNAVSAEGIIPAKSDRFKKLAAASAAYEAANAPTRKAYIDAERSDPQAYRAMRDKGISDTMKSSDRARDVLQELNRTGSPELRDIARALRPQNDETRIVYNPKQPSWDEFGIPKEEQAKYAGKTVGASYDPNTNTIELHSTDDLEHKVLHEAAHVASLNAFHANTQNARQMANLKDEAVQRSDAAAREKFSHAFSNPEEFLAESFSNLDLRQHLKSLDAGQNRSLWDKFKDTIAKFLGISDRARPLFDRVMEAGNQIIQENPSVGQVADRPVPLINKDAKEAVGTIAKAADKFVNARGALDAAKKGLLGWMSLRHMDKLYGKWFTTKDASGKTVNGITGLYEAHRARTGIVERWSTMFRGAYTRYEAMSEKEKLDLNRVMAATKNLIDPLKSWDEHTWLKGLKDSKNLEAEYKDARSSLDNLRRKGYLGLYEDMKAINEGLTYGLMSENLYTLISDDPTLTKAIKDAAINPADKFLNTADIYEQPAKARDYFERELRRQLGQVEAYRKPKKDQLEAYNLAQQGKGKGPYTGPIKSRTEAEQLERQLAPLDRFVLQSSQMMAAMKQAPYFHLGRFGNYMVAFNIKLDPSGKQVDRDAQRQVEEAFAAKGFDDVELKNSPKTGVYVRVNSKEEMEQLFNLVKSLQEKGLVSSEAGKEPIRGLRTDSTVTSRVSPDYIEKYIESIRSNPDFAPTEDAEETKQRAAERDRLISQARELWLDMMPDTALAKVMTTRKGTPGYSKNMMRSFAFRMQVGVNSLANLSTRRKITDARTAMRTALNEAKASDKVDPVAVQNVFNEISRREDEFSQQSGYDGFDMLKAISNAWYLGLNPGYVLGNLTQPGTLLWPELAKRHGFMKSAQAMARTTVPAFNIMRAVASEGMKLGFSRVLDPTISQAALEKAGLDEGTKKFVQNMVNTGAIDLGGLARELARVSEGRVGDKVDFALRTATAVGYYSEVFSRLLAALAARELHGKEKEGVEEYAANIVDETMLNYSNWNTARQTGKTGIAKKFSPLIFSFDTYQFQVLEKMYREIHDAIGLSGADKAAEARKFLGAHAIAMTTVAGTLGLPFASVLARLVDFLRDEWGDDKEPHDTKADWRNYLADVFGKEIGEVLARGAPRVFNADMSGRVGEQDLLPFSRLITDRRKWEDAVKDWKAQAWGAPTSMLGSMTEGGMRMYDGDVLAGAIEMVPNAIKAPLKAFRMTQDGYVDRHGNKLSLTPTAADILTQAIGLTPSDYANYSEKNMSQLQRDSILKRQAGELRQKMEVAIESGDKEKFQELVKEAKTFDRGHPMYATLPKLGATIERQQTKRAQAQATGLPMSTNFKDPSAYQLTRY